MSITRTQMETWLSTAFDALQSQLRVRSVTTPFHYKGDGIEIIFGEQVIQKEKQWGRFCSIRVKQDGKEIFVGTCHASPEVKWWRKAQAIEELVRGIFDRRSI